MSVKENLGQTFGGSKDSTFEDLTRKLDSLRMEVMSDVQNEIAKHNKEICESITEIRYQLDHFLDSSEYFDQLFEKKRAKPREICYWR